jgi:Zn-dependent protease
MSDTPSSGPYSSGPNYGPAFVDLRNVIAARFTVLDAFIDPNGTPSFVIAPGDTEHKFQFVVNDFSRMNLVAFLRHDGDRLLIKVFTKLRTKPSRSGMNLILLIATLGTIFFSGYIGFMNTQILREVLLKDANPYLQAGLFAVCLFSIIGIHETGHLLVCRRYNLDFTLPYFIPGPPPFGTFGAVVSLRSAPTNRNQLFDLGFAGPFAGFIATVIISILSFLLAFQVTAQQAMAWEQQKLVQQAFWPMYPLLFDILQPIVRPTLEGYSLILTQIELAAWVGALLTFLNILPVWELDGGHISRAIFGPKGHRVASAIGILVLFATGYWFFGLFILFWMFATRRGMAGAEPLDDVSPLSRSRKILYLLTLLITVLCFVSLYDFMAILR